MLRADPHCGSRVAARALVLLLIVTLTTTALVFTPQASAGPLVDCYVSGDIAAPTTWGPSCTWILNGNVTVTPSGALTILPGTSVLADVGRFLYVDGYLFADGDRGSSITFARNGSAVISDPWGGIQFNSTGNGSVSHSTFNQVERAVTVVGSSPPIHNNTILSSTIGFAFVSASASVVADNAVRQARVFGIYVNASNVQILRNAVNNTPIGIQVEQPGDPVIAQNTITNVTSGFAVGIFVLKGATAEVTDNTIRGVRGANGGAGITPGARGRDGGVALGVYVNSAPWAYVSGNTIDLILGGNGGAGAANFSGVGGRGGNGGPAAGIVVVDTPQAWLPGNTVTTVRGGRGGAGGGSAGTVTGGRGGDAAEAGGIQVALTTTSVELSWNTVVSVTGGGGGLGGDGTTVDGSGGLGGDAFGAFFIAAARIDASANWIQTVQGGFGGNSTVSLQATSGGQGGDAVGISVFSVAVQAIVHANTIDTLTGGPGGFGQPGGGGGNATGVLGLGNNDGMFNATTVSSNSLTFLTGGAGGNGRVAGGAGGSATGLGVVQVTPTLAYNSLWTLQAGRGGIGGPGGIGGRGGDAAGIIGGLLPMATSSSDSINTVTKGVAGTPGTPPAAFASGFYLVGNTTIPTLITIENGTLISVGSFDFYVDNYTEAVALNTPFTTEAIQAAGNLTVRNFLEVAAVWPNGFTPVTGVRVQVRDNGFVIWDKTAPSGTQSWIAVTDRIYINSNAPTENTTRVTVVYAPYAFVDNDRDVSMATSHTETFLMADTIAPTSAASALPKYRNTPTFPIRYTASDGNGTGLGNITLWYRTGESGGWRSYATQPAGLEGQFTFTATADGLYEFATVVDDTAGNQQPGPNANQTWTIVDTTRPASHVVPLPAYEGALTFTVSWTPDAGVTDVATYKIQYNVGAGWVDWLTGTTATSGSFVATSQGVYAFRALATDRAGNTELAPSGNDTWTIVDTIRPFATNSVPLGSNTSSAAAITITFGEPMNRSSVQQAFSMTPQVQGTFAWNADSTVMTFTPDNPLAAGTTHTVVIGTGAADLAGNTLATAHTFQFTTVPAPIVGFSVTDYWWLFLIVGAAAGGGLLMVMRRRAAGSTAAKPATAPAPAAAAPSKPSSEAIVEDLFLLYHRDGLLIKHETRRLRPDVDTDILTGMLTAVQAFVKDALRGDDYADLNEMTVGHMHILIGRGKWLVLAARIEGEGSQGWSGQIERCIKDMEDHHWDQLEDWEGDMAIARVLSPYLKKLLQGGYTLVEA